MVGIPDHLDEKESPFPYGNPHIGIPMSRWVGYAVGVRADCIVSSLGVKGVEEGSAFIA